MTVLRSLPFQCAVVIVVSDSACTSLASFGEGREVERAQRAPQHAARPDPARGVVGASTGPPAHISNQRIPVSPDRRVMMAPGSYSLQGPHDLCPFSRSARDAGVPIKKKNCTDFYIRRRTSDKNRKELVTLDQVEIHRTLRRITSWLSLCACAGLISPRHAAPFF